MGQYLHCITYIKA